MNRNLVESTYGWFFIRFPQSRMKGERHRLSPQCRQASSIIWSCLFSLFFCVIHDIIVCIYVEEIY